MFTLENGYFCLISLCCSNFSKMKRRRDARIENMVSSCLNHVYDDEGNDNEDVYDNSRSSSPIQLSSDLLGKRGKFNKDNVTNKLHDDLTGKGGDEDFIEKPALCSKLLNKFCDVANVSAEASYLSPMSHQLCMSTNLVKEMVDTKSLITNHNQYTTTAAEKNIEPRPCLLLTPRPCNALNDEASCVLSTNPKLKNALQTPKSHESFSNALTETTAEKSIEAPPYSPLTPRPLAFKSFHDHNNPLIETSAEKSIEAPPYSPLTPRPLASKSFHDHNETSAEKSVEPVLPFSPLPLMSPETRKLFHTLADSISNSEDETNASIASVRSNETYFPDSDDSARDPDYCAYNVNDHYSSADDSSKDSISLVTGITTAEINQLPGEIHEVNSYFRPDLMDVPLNNSRSHGADHQNVEVEDEIVPIVEPAIIENDDNLMTVSVQETTQTERQFMGRPKRGRKSKYGGLSREERKRRKYSNLSYVNSRKKTLSPKKFIDFQCSCSKKCHENVPADKRLANFENFYSLGSYDAQNIFLTTLIREKPVARHYATDKNKMSKKKAYARQFFLDGILVCKNMFIKTFQTSSKRINSSLCRLRSGSNITDKRGLSGGRNRVPLESEQFVIDFIKKLPTYISHYRREQTGGAKFLRADMTFSKIYELYSDEAKTAEVRILSAAKVNKLFLTKFNLRTKPLKKDTCNKCDYLQSQILHASSEEVRANIEQKRIDHQQIAESLQKQMKADLKLAKDDPSVETITFDLEKTLPLPRIPTNIVFYKRQLWVYNLGIHTGTNDEAHCNVWVKGEAGRGSQEVGSCLIKHILTRVDNNVKRLILWSDSCGGQNRNIKLTLMLKAILSDHPTIEQINMRFLESGHSFLPNDSDFGKIECALKRQQRLYTPDDYIQIMKNCKQKKPMHVHRIKNEDFLSSLNLEKNITNRKKTTDGEKVSWLNTKEILLKKSEMYNIYMRSDFNEEYKVIDIRRRTRGSPESLNKNMMTPLWPNGKPVPEAKLVDLRSMLHLIPQDSHDFYVRLVGNEAIADDLEGFSGHPDFEIEED